jgi:histone acetyltransferase
MFSKIPGIVYSGWEYRDYENFLQNDISKENFYTQCIKLLDKIRKNKNSWPFLKPVDVSEAADYYEVIKDPMDLQTLQSNLDSGTYKNKEIFVSDLKKIFTNAKVYNKPNTIYHKYARDLENSIEDDIKRLKNV